MAYAAFAKVDPRLLAKKEFVDNSLAIKAAGDAIEFIGNEIIEGMERKDKAERQDKIDARAEAQEKRAKKMHEWNVYRNQVEAQKYDAEYKRAKELFLAGEGPDPGERIVPPSFTPQGQNQINEMETKSQSTILQGKTPTEDGIPQKGQTIVTDTGEEYIVGDANLDGKVNKQDNPMYGGKNGLNSQYGGGYGVPAKTTKQAETNIQQRGVGVSRLSDVSSQVSRALQNVSLDKDNPNNAAIVALDAALDADAVQVVTNSNGPNGPQAEYVWQGADNKWYRVPVSAAFDRNGKLNINAFNGNNPLQAVFSTDRMYNVLNANTTVKTALATAQRAVLQGKRLPNGSQVLDGVENEMTSHFSENPNDLASFISANKLDEGGPDGKWVDPTPNDGITAADAAAFARGVVQGDPNYSEAFKAPEVTAQERTHNTLNSAYVDVLTNIEGKNAKWFQENGLLNARFEGGVLVYDRVKKYEEDGVVKTEYVPTRVATNKDAYSLVYNIIDKTYTGKDKTALLSNITSYEKVLTEKYGDKFTGEQEKPKGTYETTLETALKTEDYSTFDGQGRISKAQNLFFGNSFTVILDNGKKETFDPDNAFQMKRFKMLVEGKSDEYISNALKQDIPDIPLE